MSSRPDQPDRFRRFRERMATYDKHSARRETRRHGALSREQIAAAALAIANSQGFDAVSMRKVAAVLGSGTMTLYHYVRTKDDLVALMDDAIMGEVLVPGGRLPGHWRAALTEIARRTRDAFDRHRWALTALLRAPPPPNGMRHFEQSLAAVADTRLTPEQKFEMIALVDDFVFGHVLRSIENRGDSIEETAAESSAFAERELATGAYPHIAAMFGGDDPLTAAGRISGGLTPEQRFERGLQTVLDGVAARFGLPG